MRSCPDSHENVLRWAIKWPSQFDFTQHPVSNIPTQTPSATPQRFSSLCSSSSSSADIRLLGHRRRPPSPRRVSKTYHVNCLCSCFTGKKEARAYKQCNRKRFLYCSLSVQECTPYYRPHSFGYRYKGKWCSDAPHKPSVVTTRPPTTTTTTKAKTKPECLCYCTKNFLLWRPRHALTGRVPGDQVRE